MTDSDADIVDITEGKSAKDLFPGYYPPAVSDRKNAYLHGLISIDANALLDLYRFTAKARNELFEILETLQPRLFFTHQAVLEFYRSRLSVVKDRLGAAEVKCNEIKKPLSAIINNVREFARRYQIDSEESDRLVAMVTDLSSTLTEAIQLAGTYDLPSEEIEAATDSVLQRFEVLSKDRIGTPLNDEHHKAALVEAARRRSERIPPGYADEKKQSPELQAGDYILWRQLRTEAAIHQRPVLLITNEQKEDWVSKDSSNRILGPRPELVLEMLEKSRVALLTVSVIGLLIEARDFLGISVSSSTIREAESLPRSTRYSIRFSDEANDGFLELTHADRDSFQEFLRNFGDSVLAQHQGDIIPDSVVMLRFSPSGRAIAEVHPDPEDESIVVIDVIEINA